MRHSTPAQQQRGATLIVSLIMLLLITLMVTSGFTMSNSTLMTTGNLQSRDQAIAAGNRALEQVVSSPFASSPTSQTITVDIDNNDSSDYEVDVAAPTCVSAQQVTVASSMPYGLAFGGGSPPPASNFYETVWDLNALVTDSRTGTSVRVRQGVRVLLSEAQYTAVCT